VVEPDELAASVERHADGVEPEVGAERPVRDLGQPRGGHRADLLLLGAVQVVAPVTGAEPPRLDLAEDDGRLVLVGQHEVDLAEPRPVVAAEHAVAETGEVLGGELLAAAAQLLRVVGRHDASDRTRRG
jgi:hypothetical protein